MHHVNTLARLSQQTLAKAAAPVEQLLELNRSRIAHERRDTRKATSLLIIFAPLWRITPPWMPSPGGALQASFISTPGVVTALLRLASDQFKSP